MVNRANQWWVDLNYGNYCWAIVIIAELPVVIRAELLKLEINYGNYSWAIVIIAELPIVIRAELLKLEMNNNNKVPIVTSKCWHKVTSHEL